MVPRAGIRLETLRLSTPDSLVKMPLALGRLAGATLRCLRLLRDFGPDVVFSTGGFVSVPATIAAWARRTPVVIYLPDARPGRAVRLTARLARTIAVSAPESRDLLPCPNRAVVTGYPIRESLWTVDRDAAREAEGLQESDLQLLVVGGSLGARAINRAIGRDLQRLTAAARVVHVCGDAHLDEMEAVRRSLQPDQADRYQVHGRLDQADLARQMVASDLAVTRGGASILGELPAAGLPAVVVPLPASGVGQSANAAVLERAGACVVMANEEVENGSLTPMLLDLLDDPERREAMRQALLGQRQTSAAGAIANLILDAARAA